jgi:hypothetical protein
VTYVPYDLSCETPDGVAITDLTGIQSVRESSPADCSGPLPSRRGLSGAAARSRSDLCRVSLAARPSVGPAQLTGCSNDQGHLPRNLGRLNATCDAGMALGQLTEARGKWAACTWHDLAGVGSLQPHGRTHACTRGRGACGSNADGCLSGSGRRSLWRARQGARPAVKSRHELFSHMTERV